MVNELTLRFFISNPEVTEQEIKEFLEAENQCLIDEGKPGINIETTFKMIWDRRAEYFTDHTVSIRLRGEFKTRRVWLNDDELLPHESLKLRNHSPDGFNWSYGGSGPAQLALAVCDKMLGPDKALAVYQEFKWKIIAVLPATDFDVTINIETRGNTIKSTHASNAKH